MTKVNNHALIAAAISKVQQKKVIKRNSSGIGPQSLNFNKKKRSTSKIIDTSKQESTVSKGDKSLTSKADDSKKEIKPQTTESDVNVELSSVTNSFDLDIASEEQQKNMSSNFNSKLPIPSQDKQSMREISEQFDTERPLNQ